MHSVFRLTLGLMGLDELHLRVLATSSEDIRQRKDAQTGDLLHYTYIRPIAQGSSVLRLMKKGKHWVLVVRAAAI